VAVSRAVTRLGDNRLVWPAVLGASTVAGLRERRCGAGVGPVATLALASASRRALAELVGRSRPPRRLWRSDWVGPSFPSRHTTMAALGTFLTAGALAPGARRSRASVCAGVGVGVGLTRLVLGVHWPSDVVAAWAYVALVVSATGWLPQTRA
jgi:undecaprenyl-diphosphatase